MMEKTINNDLTNLAVNIVIKNRQVDSSITNPVSLLQRHLILGYKDALELLEELKRKGVISEDSKNTNSYIVHIKNSD